MNRFDTFPPGWEHHHVSETASTMLDLTQQPYTDVQAPFLLLTADYQTAGRGQRGTSWESDRGENLLFGIRFSPSFVRADHQFLLSEVQALAVAEVLEEEVGAICVKWPNDIYWLSNKICGMLLEHTLVGTHIQTTVTGVGLNLNQVIFNSDAPNPISLAQITGSRYELDRMMRRIAWRFDRLYRQLANGGEAHIHRTYLRRLFWRDGFAHPFRDGQGNFRAEVRTVLPDGQLVLRDEEGRLRTYAFKEVQFLINAR